MLPDSPGHPLNHTLYCLSVNIKGTRKKQEGSRGTCEPETLDRRHELCLGTAARSDSGHRNNNSVKCGIKWLWEKTQVKENWLLSFERRVAPDSR